MQIPEIISNIYDVFKEYYGEDFVDLQKFRRVPYSDEDCPYASFVIVVYWPEVEIFNEANEHITIWKLFGKIMLADDGSFCKYPIFTRSEYDERQWESQYTHSHIPSLDTSHPERFRGSCLGSGPIRHTIAKIHRDTEHSRGADYDRSIGINQYTDMDVWRLFAWELDKYVHVESISGGPYIRMSSVGSDTSGSLDISHPNKILLIRESPNYFLNPAYKKLIKEIASLILQKNIVKITYCNGNYTLGMSPNDFIFKATDAFIEYYNSDKTLQKKFPKKTLESIRFLDKVKISDKGYFQYNSQTNDSSRRNQFSLESKLGTKILTFKGHDICLTKHELGNIDDSYYTIINLSILGYILYYILKYTNIYYGKSENRDKKDSSTASRKEVII